MAKQKSRAPRPLAYSYIRMSTAVQLRGDSLRRQKRLSKEFAERHKLQLVEKFQLHDIGVSAFRGANVARGSALGGFVEAVRAGKIPRGSYLIMEHLDRFSREKPRISLERLLSLVNAGINIATTFDDRIYSAEDDGIDRQLDRVMWILSNSYDESEKKRKRLSEAWQQKRDRDKTLTSICPLWLRFDKRNAEFSIISERQKVVQQIFEYSAEGLGSYSVVKRLVAERVSAFRGKKGWSTSSVSKLLTNRAVLGEFQPHRMKVDKRIPDGPPRKGYFPAVISESLFYRSERARSNRLSGGGGRKGLRLSNLFSKLATCAYCDAPMRYENKGRPPKGGSYLVCGDQRRGILCGATSWRYDDFETSFLAFVQEINLYQILAKKADSDELKDISAELDTARARKATNDNERQNLIKFAKLSGGSQLLADELRELDAKADELKQRIFAQTAAQKRIVMQQAAILESREQIKPLILELKRLAPEAAYRQRAQIASRLKDLIQDIVVATAGSVPLVDAMLGAELADKNPNEDAVAALAQGGDPQRYFTVLFKDGTFRRVEPNNADPFAFKIQNIGSGSKTFDTIEFGKRPIKDLPDPFLTSLANKHLNPAASKEGKARRPRRGQKRTPANFPS